MIVLIYGPEEYLNELHIKNLIKKGGFQKTSINQFDTMTSSLETAIDIYNSDNLLSEKKLVIVRNVENIFNKKDKNNTKQLILLKEIIKFNLENVLVLLSNNNILKDQFEIINYLKSIKKVIYNKKLNKNDISKIIAKGVLNRGLTMDDSLFDLLSQKCSNSLRNIIMELNKLSLIKKPITKNIINSFVYSSGKNNIFQLLDFVFDKKHQEAMVLYRQIIRNGISPVAVLSLISLQLGLLCIINEGISSKKTVDEISLITKKPSFVIYKYMRLLKKINPDRLSKILTKISTLESKIKSGQIRELVNIELIIIETLNLIN